MGRTGSPSDLGLGVGLDLPSRTYTDRPNLLYNYLVFLMLLLLGCRFLAECFTFRTGHGAGDSG